MKSSPVYILITIVITSCLLTVCSKSRGIENAAPSVDPSAIPAVLSQCDAGFKERQDLSKLRDAITQLATVRDPGNRDFEVEKRFAEFNYFLGIHTDNEKEAAAAFEKGREAGKIATKLQPEKPDGYFWY